MDSEVRRVVLFNLDKTDETIPYILERARDIDGINRRVVFLKPMAEIDDFRTLTLQQRNDLLKWGLNDRYIYPILGMSMVLLIARLLYIEIGLSDVLPAEC